MGDDGSGVRRVAGLHPTEEGQEGGRVLWYSVVRPRRELELTNLPLLTRTILETTERGGVGYGGGVLFGVTDRLYLCRSKNKPKWSVCAVFRYVADIDMVHGSRHFTGYCTMSIVIVFIGLTTSLQSI